MITLDRIRIREFRGIRDFEFEFNRESFVVYGANGTGKSGVIDAIEFGLTGKISRLSGEGTGEISLKKHAPHIDCHDVDLSSVSIDLYIPVLDKEVNIFRRVCDPSNPVVTPDEVSVIELIKKIEMRPEFCLSRRQLLKLIFATPGDRAQYVQTILQLEQIDTLRLSLNRIIKSIKKDRDDLLKKMRVVQGRLQQHFDIQPVSVENILTSVNKRRNILKLKEITDLNPTTAINEGIGQEASSPRKSFFVKTTAVSDLQLLIDSLSSYDVNIENELLKNTFSIVELLLSNEDDLKHLRVEDFLQTAIDLYDGSACPVCETSFETKEFISIVLPKIEYFKVLSNNKKILSKYFDEIKESVRSVEDLVSAVVKYGACVDPPVEVGQLVKFNQLNKLLLSELSSLLPLNQKKEVISKFVNSCNESKSIVEVLLQKVVSLPNPSQEEAAKTFLTVGQVLLDEYRSVRRGLKAIEEKSVVMQDIIDLYNKTSTNFLNLIYDSIEKDFISFYRYVNSEDESTFEAKLTPAKGKLDFFVDFYGRGYHHPCALHSEGHQDGMGLCLYLSLMKYLFSNNFKLAVLDDVLMSVDTGHRRQFSRLLKSHFPSTQFIITTHDKVWFNHLKADGIVPSKGFVNFRSWSVELGPTAWQKNDIWQEIDSYLSDNDVHKASFVLRRYLEYISEEICHRIHAPIPYRSDARYTLGDFLPNGYSAMKKLLKQGKNVAELYKNSVNFEIISHRESKLIEAYKVAKIDDWQINSAVHYNNWENLDKSDFLSVATSYRSLVDQFKCYDCNGLLSLLYTGVVGSAISCPCGNTFIKLIFEK